MTGLQTIDEDTVSVDPAALKKLVGLVETQRLCGGTDDYHRGLLNGLICAVSVLTGQEPIYAGISPFSDCERTIKEKK